MGAEAGRPTQSHILERLSADKDAKDFEILVLAALEGPEALTQALDAKAQPQPKQQKEQPKPPQAAYFQSLTVEGFRGIGPQTKLDITPGPGLTLVVGRNGSGKSSFAEALELLLKKDTYRWKKRTKQWRDGWRNLHHKTARIEAECLIEGKKGPTQIRQTWTDGQALEDGDTVVQPHGEPKTDRAALGWDGPLTTYRPFLSYNELGSLLEDRQAPLFDALAQILGTDDLTEAEETLAAARKEREDSHKDCEQQRKQIVDTLATSEDPRAKALAAILIKKDWDAAQAARENENCVAADSTTSGH